MVLFFLEETPWFQSQGKYQDIRLITGETTLHYVAFTSINWQDVDRYQFQMLPLGRNAESGCLRVYVCVFVCVFVCV